MAKTRAPAPFDRLRRDKTYGGYAKKLEHRGHTIDVCFDAENDDELQALLPTAQKFWKARVRWFKAFREFCAIELIAELNGILDCGQDNFQKVTAAQLRKLLPVPFGVRFTSQYDDSGEIYFQMDGGEDKATLQENCFCVWGSLDQGIVEGEVVTLL